MSRRHQPAAPEARTVPAERDPTPRPPGRPRALPPSRLHLKLLLGAAFLTAAVFLAPVLLTGRYYWGSGTDIQSYQYPHREFAFHWLRRGMWPLWNPYIFGGVPYQTGVHPLAYPGTILGLIFPTGVEIKLTVLLHLALALFFMAALLRSLRYSLLSAHLGGIVYALSGFGFAHLYAGHVDIVTTFAFAPLVLWSLERALRRSGAGWTLLAGLALALMIISGHYQVVYLAVFGAGLFTLGRVLLGGSHAVPRLSWRAPWNSSEVDRDDSGTGDPAQDCRLLALSRVTGRERVRDLGWWLARVAVLGAVAGLVSLFQTLPTQQSMQLSNRFRGADFAFATSSGVPKVNWLTYLVPGFFGGTARTPFWPSWSAWEGQAYFGLAAMLLALLAVALGTRRHWLPLLVVVLIGTALAMGEYSPFYRLYFAIDPLVARFRVPSRFILPVSMGAAWLAAQGLELALRRSGPVPWRRLGVVFAPVLALLAGGWLWLMTSSASPDSPWARFVRGAVGPEHWEDLGAGRARLVVDALQNARGQTTLALVIAGVTVALLAWLLRAGGRPGSRTRPPARKAAGDRGGVDAAGGLIGADAAGPPGRRLPALLLVLLAGADLLVFAQPYLSTREPGRFELPRETAAFLQQRVGTARMLSAPKLRALNWGESRGLSHFGGYDTIISDQYNRAVNLAMGYEADRRVMVMSAFNYGPLWQIQGVRYLLSPEDLAGGPESRRPAFAGFQPIGRPGGIYVYENPGAFPRAFAVHRTYPAGSAEDALALVTSRPDLVRSGAIVSIEDQAALRPSLPDSVTSAADEVSIESLTPNQVAVTARLAAPGLVVLTDQPWPGWQVEVDGARARLWSVNASLHRAVLVPAGNHRVRFHYFPPALRWGLVFSIATLALVLFYLGWGRFSFRAGA